MEVRAHLLISGVVQGVFYRASARDKATYLKLKGWVRNLRNGDVEAVFEGPPKKVEEMVSWCRRGPPSARVDEVKVDMSEKPEGIVSFSVVQ